MVVFPRHVLAGAETLRATALSRSHLTWSFTATTIRTCHQTTSFPV